MRGPGGPNSPGRVARRLGVTRSWVHDRIKTGVLYTFVDGRVYELPEEEIELLGILAPLHHLGVLAPQLASLAAWLRTLPREERPAAARRVVVARFARGGAHLYRSDAEVPAGADPQEVFVAALQPSGQFGSPDRRST